MRRLLLPFFLLLLAIPSGAQTVYSRAWIVDFYGQPTPANPPTNFGRVYFDQTTQTMKCRTSAGADCWGTGGGGAPTGAAGGDLGGTYPNPTVVSVADVTTGVLSPANGGVGKDNVAGQGFYFLPYGDYTLNGTSTGVIAAMAGANNVRAGLIHLLYAITFTRVSINVTTTSNTNHYYIGIYSADKNTLIRQATFTLGAGTGVLSTTVASTTLTPGAYYLAWSADNTTAVVQGTTANGTAAGALLQNQINYLGLAANATSAGVMPASLGALNGTLYQMPDVLLEP